MNILKARAISREDHIAIDTFYVSYGKTGRVESEKVRSAFEQSIETILMQGEKALELVREQYELSQKKGSILAQNPFDAAFPVRVDLYFDEELRQIVADYQGKDRIGLLYRVSRTLSKEGLNIDSVRIATNNGIATGTLLLSDENRKRKVDAERLEVVREKLIAILSSEKWLDA
jgi:[protein-PII] uridylyltransferase